MVLLILDRYLQINHLNYTENNVTDQNKWAVILLVVEMSDSDIYTELWE